MDHNTKKCKFNYTTLSIRDKQEIAMELFKDKHRTKIFGPVRQFYYNKTVDITRKIEILDEKYRYNFYGLISCVGLVMCQFTTNKNTGGVNLINGLAVHVVDSPDAKEGHYYCNGWTKSGKQLLNNVTNKISKWDTDKKVYGLFVVNVLNVLNDDEETLIKNSTKNIIKDLKVKFETIEFQTYSQKGTSKYNIQLLGDIMFKNG